MTTEFQVTAHQFELNRIVNDVLDVMFCTNSDPSGQNQPGNDSYTATVRFAGDWQGALLVRCDRSTADDLARRLVKTSSVSPEDVSDAMGELANMIGGNIKSVLPPGVVLSVPEVVFGKEVHIPIFSGNEAKSTLYACELGDFEVTLVRFANEPC